MFQQSIDIILEQCSGTLDDVVVYGRDKSEHDAHRNCIMQVASQEGLVFNSKKCEIKGDNVIFFGTIYDSNGTHSDPDKISAIRELPSPATGGASIHTRYCNIFISIQSKPNKSDS